METREHRKPYLADCTRTTVKQIPGINSSKQEFENVFRISQFLAFGLETERTEIVDDGKASRPKPLLSFHSAAVIALFNIALQFTN